jgi:hypothetical protein
MLDSCAYAGCVSWAVERMLDVVCYSRCVCRIAYAGYCMLVVPAGR